MHGHTHGVSRDRPDFVRSAPERCRIDGCVSSRLNTNVSTGFGPAGIRSNEMKSDDLSREPLEKLVDEFAALAIEAEDLFMVAPVRKRNRIVDRYRSIGDEILSRGEAGASAMTALMAHEDIAARGAAAARCLFHNVARDQAINVLADICDLREGNVSMNAAAALMVAGEFDMKTGPIRRPT